MFAVVFCILGSEKMRLVMFMKVYNYNNNNNNNNNNKFKVLENPELGIICGTTTGILSCKKTGRIIMYFRNNGDVIINEDWEV